MSPPRNRLLYAIAIILVIILGLLSRSELASKLPQFIIEYSGDTLWALALFLMFAFLRPHSRTAVIAVLTLICSFSIEISQLYQGAWISTIRSTTIGALILGRGFLWTDLLCYVTGIMIGAIGESWIFSLNKTKMQNGLHQKTTTQ